MPALGEQLATRSQSVLPPFHVIYRSERDPQCCVGVRFDGEREEVALYRGKVARLVRDRMLDPDMWFVLPTEIAGPVLTAAKELQARKKEEIRRGYQEMAADVEAEAEALEWCEALIGDGFDSEER